MNNIIKALVGVAALLSTALAQAVHLGDLRTSSVLGEPYAAIIPLYAPTPDELAGAAVDVIADPLLGRQASMRRILDSMSGEIVEDASGSYIAIRSNIAVNEPILAFRVELASGTQSVSRAYSAIIDPRPASVPARVRTVPPAAADDGPAESLRSYGPVQPGETLWKIARAVGNGYGGSTNAVMAALVDANPQAFINGDMNRLIAGAVLRIPLALDGADAAPRRATTAGAVPKAGSPVAVSSATEPSAAAADAGIVPRSVDWRVKKPALARNLADMDAKFAALRERYGMTGTAASTQGQEARTSEPAPVEATPTPTPAPVRAPAADAEAARAAEVQLAETPAASVPTEVDADPAEPATGAQQPAAPAIAAVAPPAVARSPEVPEQTTGIGERVRILLGLIPFKLLAYAALIGLALWGAMRALARYWKRSRAVTAERVHYDLEAERREEVARKARQRLQLEAEVRRIIDDHEDTKSKLKEAGLEALTGGDGESMTEIDMSITHGRYQRAEKLLREVIREAPRNTAARLRLAEVYYITERVDDFVAEVRELRDSHRQRISDADWQKLMRMGKVVAPDDPLFGGLSSVVGENRQA